jgi:hypothetical protein
LRSDRDLARRIPARPLPTTLLVLLVVLVAGCSPDRDEASLFAPGDIDVPVVDALLLVDAPLPDIRLTRTIAPDAEFVFEEAAIVGARVRVIVAGADTVVYAEDSAGIYLPIDPAPTVQPDTRYDLDVTTDAGERVTATTVTPGRLQIAEWVLLDDAGEAVQRRLRTFAELGDGVYDAPENQLVYPEGLLEGRLVAPDAPGFQLSVASLDLDSELVTDIPFLDDEDIAELDRSGSSPALEIDSDEVGLPWFSILWQGRYVFRVLMLDGNTFDLVRTSPEAASGAFQFGGNAGEGFERPLFRVEGGIGLFGSASIDSIGFTILPPE